MYTVEYSSALNKSAVMTLHELEKTMLSEKTQTQKDKHHKCSPEAPSSKREFTVWNHCRKESEREPLHGGRLKWERGEWQNGRVQGV